MKRKPLKNPNGFGSVSFLGKRRRKPYGARVTVGWELDDNGKAKQKIKYLSYHETREEALIALAEYKKNPYNLNDENYTFSEVYDEWSRIYFETLSNPSSKRTIESGYKYCKPLYDMKMRDIRTSHLEKTILDADVGDPTKQRIKSIFNMMYKYALAHDMADRDYAQLCFVSGNPISKSNPKEKVPFSDEEIKKLWDNIDIPFVDMILIGIYTGWRPQELSILKIADIDLEKGFIKGGLKTDAGRNRLVPILSGLQALITARMNEADKLHSEYLFNDITSKTGVNLTYDKYNKRFKKVMELLSMKHSPHETRHTFITLAKNSNVDEYILKLIVGHSITDITEKTYTHRTLKSLKEEIEKIEIKKG